MGAQSGYQPRNTPAERRAFFEVERQIRELLDALAAANVRIDDLETRVEVLEAP